jgi:hypothetical protein
MYLSDISIFKSNILLADSVQVYKYLDIGSNKPTIEEMNETPHHCVNICDPHDTFSCGDFVRLVAPIIRYLSIYLSIYLINYLCISLYIYIYLSIHQRYH